MPDLDVFMTVVERALDDLGFKTRWWRRRYRDWYRQDFLAEVRHAAVTHLGAEEPPKPIEIIPLDPKAVLRKGRPA